MRHTKNTPNFTTHNKPHKPTSIHGFTLVELIVVITILVILGTIAFINLGGFAGSARDSARISNLNSLKTGLDLVQIKSGSYPMPEGKVDITASGANNIIGYQGYAGEQVGSIAKLSPGATKDPLDPTMYITYSVNATQSKMQAMSFLEDSSTATAFVSSLAPTANASSTSDYSKRFPKTTGDSLGILLSNTGTTTLNQPVQETNAAVDVVTTTGSYIAYFNNKDQISGDGTKLVALKSSMISPSSLPTRDTSLVGYWDMETTVGSGLLADLSGNGNNGTPTGTTSTSGKRGNARSFNGASDVINTTFQFPVGANAKSFSVWMNTNDVAQGQWVIGGGADVDGNAFGLFLSTSLLLFHGNSVTYDMEFNTSLKNTTWYLVTITYDGNTIRGYINDKLISTKNMILNTTAANMRIGQRQSGANTFSGSIDEVRIYNRALSDSEIQTLYNATK